MIYFPPNMLSRSDDGSQANVMSNLFTSIFEALQSPTKDNKVGTDCHPSTLDLLGQLLPFIYKNIAMRFMCIK